MDLWACPAVVTGAASGLGAETARYLAEAGAKVTVIDIDGDGVQKIAQEIGGLAIPCDVANSQAAENALATARDAHGAATMACWSGFSRLLRMLRWAASVVAISRISLRPAK